VYKRAQRENWLTSVCGITNSTWERALMVTTRKEQTRPATVGRIESASHADITAAGSSFLLISEMELTCTVKPFSNTYKTLKKIPIVTAATAYNVVVAGVTFVLVFHQALWFGNDLKNSLICLQQVRSYVSFMINLMTRTGESVFTTRKHQRSFRSQWKMQWSN